MTRAWLVVAIALAPVIAHAEDEIVRGAVIRIEAKEIYVSLGSAGGVTDGSALRLKRTITLHHPVTHQTVEDWIPIGSATITQAGAVMSRAVIGELVADVKVGDIAEVLIDRPEPARTTTALAPPSIDPATAEVLGLFQAQAGQPLEARIAAWERYLSIRSSSPFADGVRRDLDTLHALRDQLRSPTAAQNAETLATVAHSPPRVAAAGIALPLVFVIDQPDRVASAYLHYRPRGERTYKRLLLAREHDIYLRGAVPAQAVLAPGVDYFVEVSTPSGQSGLALATPAEPVAVAVESPPLIDRFASAPGRSSVRLAVDYLDFATLDKRAGDRRDRMAVGTVDFTYRLASAVESLGVGYGAYSGRGGYADRVWSMADPLPSSGFQYGYADIELGGHVDGVHVSTGGQLIAGVGEGGFGLGAEGRVRLGDRDATNLLLIARTVDQVGFLSDIRFATRPWWPIIVGVSVGATNQPNDGDIGVKLGTDVELVGSRSYSVILKASWQGRSTEHAGVGGGGGLELYW